MGGVQKEFFQNIVERIFDPEVGMFDYSEDTRRFNISPMSLESQYVYLLQLCLVEPFNGPHPCAIYRS